jgi:hypothetical protein
MEKRLIFSAKVQIVAWLSVGILFSCNPEKETESAQKYPSYSGIYPHLAFYNSQGECGTGAVVPWAGKLWAITYSPHFPNGSDDKLYEIDGQLNRIIRPESIGGTPANRMIHKESNQLFIGPYAINSEGVVRAISYDNMMGRHTGNARHLSDPANKIYYASMEEGFYEVDVHTLEVNTIYADGHNFQKPDDMSQHAPLLPGAHGKGLYSGQGVLVYSNNGEASQQALRQFDIESGVLAEWDGSAWKIVRRNQFVEVTGPGGIYGNEHPETDPIWATGWDHKSLLLGVRDIANGWSFYRLPKASHSYDGAHGWNTEWPRIRDVGTDEMPDYLMTMHGMFWSFPEEFTSRSSAGLRPRSSYLKVIGDFARWNDQLVFGCDDSAQKEFLNKRSVKGGIEGPGQSNSNLWFTLLDKPDNLGPATASGALWLEENVKSNVPSEPFLFDGWDHRSVWIANHGSNPVVYSFTIDEAGNGDWQVIETLNLHPGAALFHTFTEPAVGEWVRVSTDMDTKATVIFAYEDEDERGDAPEPIFDGLALVGEAKVVSGLLYGLGDNRRKMGVSSRDQTGRVSGYYELDSAMNLVLKNDAETQQFIEEKFAIPKQVIVVEEASILIVDDSGRRWRLPKGNEAFDPLIDNAQMRICREVATERDLFNCHGTFYELPAENADGFAKIRPIASHNFRIHDYASYRGMLIMTGIDPEAKSDAHIIRSEDGKAALWAGVIDDLWMLGKPVGVGGPWKNSKVGAGVPSDPYLMGFYDQTSVALSHDSESVINFTIEVNPLGHGPWMSYKTFEVLPDKKLTYDFPTGFQARWVRVVADKNCRATTWFEYR